MYCPYCGTKLGDGQLFCHICGESQIFEEDEQITEDSVNESSGLSLPVSIEEPAPSKADDGVLPASLSDETEAPAKEQTSASTAERAVKPAPNRNERLAAGSSQKDNGKNQKKQMKKSNEHSAFYREFFLHMGVKRLAICCAGAIAIVLVIVALLSAAVKNKRQRVLAIVSDDLNYFVGEDSTVLEMGYTEDAVAYTLGGTPAAALSQISNAVISSKNVLVYLDDYIEPKNAWTLKLNDLKDPTVEIRIDSGVYSELMRGSCGTRGEFNCEWKMNEAGSIVYYIKDMTDRGGSLCCYKDGEVRTIGSNCVSFDISPDGQRVAWVSCDINGSACILSAASLGKKGLAEQLDTQLGYIVGYDEGLDAIYYTRFGTASVNPLSVYVAGLSTDKERLVSAAGYVSPAGADGGFFYTFTDDQANDNLYWHGSNGEEKLVTRKCSLVVFTDAERGYVIFCTESDGLRSYYLYAGGISRDLGNKWAVEATENSDGSTVYIVLTDNGIGRALYSCDISAKAISDLTLISENCSELLFDEESDTLFYAVYSENNTNRTGLYMYDGKETHLLSDDAYPMVVYGGKNLWAFFTDVQSAQYTEESPNLASGTLCVYSKGDVTVVDNNVAMLYWHFADDGTIVYIKDYFDTFGGLMCSAEPGKTPVKIAIDAQAVIPENGCLKAFGR